MRFPLVSMTLPVSLLCRFHNTRNLYITLYNHFDPGFRSQIAAPVGMCALLSPCEFLLDVAMKVRPLNKRHVRLKDSR